MQLRLAKFHFVGVFEDLLGIRPAPPGHTGDTNHTWRMAPGAYPRGFGRRSYGGEGVVTELWDPARPAIWDVDLPAAVKCGFAAFASGVLVRDPDGWRYFEAPDREPLLLAGIVRGAAMSIVTSTHARLPYVVPEQLAPAWVRAESSPNELLKLLPAVDRAWFRSWPIEPPDDAPTDSPAIVEQLLE